MSSFTSSVPVILPGIYSSINRPLNPFIGEAIWESDTGLMKIYYGGALGWLPPWNVPWGDIAENVSGGDNNYAALNSVTNSYTRMRNSTPNNSVTWTCILGRIYLVTVEGAPENSSTTTTNWPTVTIGDRSLEIDKDNFVPTNLAASRQYTRGGTASTGNPKQFPAIVVARLTGVQGVKTFDLRGGTDGLGSGNMKAGSVMRVRDIGSDRAPVIT